MGKIALRLALLRRIVRPLGVFVHRQKADEVPLGAVNGHLTQGALGGTWASCAPQALASGPKHGLGLGVMFPEVSSELIYTTR